jgi:hypothetical protein
MSAIEFGGVNIARALASESTVASQRVIRTFVSAMCSLVRLSMSVDPSVEYERVVIAREDT